MHVYKVRRIGVKPTTKRKRKRKRKRASGGIIGGRGKLTPGKGGTIYGRGKFKPASGRLAGGRGKIKFKKGGRNNPFLKPLKYKATSFIKPVSTLLKKAFLSKYGS